MILLFLNCIHFLFRIKNIYSINMSSIKIVDINEGAKQEEAIEEVKEEAKEEAKEEVKEEVNEVIKEEQAMEENKENIKPNKEETEDLKNNSKTERLKDKQITCPKCSKTMLLRSYRYKHEKNCQGKLEDRTIKTRPISKAQPKAHPKAQPKIENTIEQEPQPTVKSNETSQIPKHQTLQNEIARDTHNERSSLSPYELARQSYIQMKEAQKQKRIEKINNFKSKMF